MSDPEHLMTQPVPTSRIKHRFSWLLAAVIGVSLNVPVLAASGLALSGIALAGCGDDGGSKSKKPRPKAKPRKRRRRGKKGKGAKGNLQFYEKIEDFAEQDEVATIRHRFTRGDFEPDITGDENRDPFRSYVVRQPGLGQQNSTDEAVETTDICNKQNLVAQSYSLRDLRLIGIVLRGTRSYALFRDSAAYGHIVRKGDCLGQEKARVTAIRAGFVSMAMPDTSLAATEPEGTRKERVIQLYPEALNLDAPR